MFGLTALELARIQFGFTMSFHILFPAITIGLASYLAVLEALWLWRKEEVYRDLYHFWSRIFAVNFAMGVVSGIVMAYQFGTNWSYYSTFAGGITGPLLAYEVLSAFFLEAGFLGVMLFGWRKVGPGLHFFATIMVAVGTLVSSFWILASNSWMHTPQGHEIINGVVVPVDWLAVIFNPSLPYRLAHMTMAAFISTALFVGASGAWHLLRGNDGPRVRTMFSMAMWMLLFAVPVQIALGDLHGLNTLEHQPAKVAAMEGHWQNGPAQEGMPLILFGWPDMQAQQTRYKVEVPHLSSVILTHSWTGQIQGLKDFAARDRPPVLPVFWGFRVMVGLGVLMLALSLWAAWLRWRQRLYSSRPFLRFALAMGPAGLVALLAGWYVTEIGRQPWVVQGLQRTADAVSPHAAPVLATSLALFVVVYFLIFGAGLRYMLKLVAKRPEAHPHEPDGDDPRHRPARPMSAADDGAGGAPAASKEG